MRPQASDSLCLAHSAIHHPSTGVFPMPDEQGSQMLEAFKTKGTVLAERWSQMPGKALRGYDPKYKIDFLAGIQEEDKRAMIAHLLENTRRYINGLDESTRMAQVGSFEKFMVQRVSSHSNMAA